MIYFLRVSKLNEIPRTCKNDVEELPRISILSLILVKNNGDSMKKQQAKTIDDYISGFPEEVQDVLNRVRETIRKSAPDAEETISYQIPTFRLNGNLVHFAAFKKHIGFYPTPSGMKHFQQDLSDFETAKGSVKFPLDKPIPFDLISKITTFRVREQQSGHAE
jgi:uncharacterized protein YdhG (YjbR/CyaY superfamily)